jgi:NAD+ kinase
VSDGRQIRVAGLIAHVGRAAAVRAAGVLLAWLREHGVATRDLSGESVGADESVPADRFAAGLDLVVAVGGDGTLLRAARLATEADAPLLGVNVGRVGFLTEVTPNEAPALLERVLAGRMEIDDRTAVVARPRGAPWGDPQWALNEIMVEKKSRHRLITLRARIGDQDVATFSADGVMVATPTGSTAYSFSARGPIVSPRVDCLLLTPVSPHMVFDRSIVIEPSEGVELEVLGDEPGLLSADGRPGLDLPVGATVRIERAERPVRLIRRADGPGFYALLREKFSLPGQAPHASADPVEDPFPSSDPS